MKTKQILVSLIAVVALMAMVSFVAAATLNVSLVKVELDNVDVLSGSTTIAAMNDGTLPVEVAFTAFASASDVRVKAWFSGFRTDLEDETSRFEVLSGRTYNKMLSVNLPSDIPTSDEYTLHIRVDSKTGSQEWSFPVSVQRESYDLRVLSVDFDRSVSAGETLAIDVVLKNRGFNRLDDTFVKVSIPELNVEKKVYFGDITPNDTKSGTDKEDAVLGRLYVKIPASAESGIYNVDVEAYNSDSDYKVSQILSVESSATGSKVLAPMKTKEASKNGEVSYDLILVNSGSTIGVYELSAESVDGLNVRVDEPIVTVGAGSSRTVKVSAMPTSTGTKTFAVNVYRDGKLVDTVSLVADVTSSGISGGNNAVILTVILAIVFLVLLVILIVLLTKKPSEKSEESFGESYY